MRTATVHEIKKELSSLSPGALIELCLRLAKYKKDNKELLTFLLFEAHDTEGYMESVRQDMKENMEALSSNSYLLKKGLRKILRTTNKYIRYAANKEVEVELLLYFCQQVKERKLPISKSTQLSNLYEQLLKKIQKAISGLHEDLQYDYLKRLKGL